MSHSLRIAIADDEAGVRDFLGAVLLDLGHQVVALARTGRELVEQCRACQPDLVFTDIFMPEMDGIDAAAQLFQERPVAIILLSGHHEPDLVERATQECILAYLVKPIKVADLAPAIALAMKRFDQVQDLQKETANLRQALEDRKVIERAKGVLMKRAGIDEAEAFRRLQMLASNKRRKLAEIAEMILVAEEGFKATD